ncbi:MAG: hypothetical protein ACOX68_01840 [Candidatus Limivicinus sp.]|jgi:hypothetical protein
MKFRKISIISVILLLLFSLTACGGCSREDFGLYRAEVLEAGGDKLPPEDIYNGSCTLELSSLGRAVLTLGEDSFPAMWKCEDGELSLDVNGAVSTGSLDDGICTIDFADSGLVYTFLREGASLPEESRPVTAGEPTDVQRRWNGDWYGWWCISNGQGDWAELSGQKYDCFSRIETDKDGNGTMLLWDEKLSADEPMAEAQIRVTAETAESYGGYFWQRELEKGEWSFTPAELDFENILYLDCGHYESPKGSFDYQLLLRPWGQSWEDIEEAAPDYLPYFYKSWYLPGIEEGLSMPDKFDESMIQKEEES